MQTVRRRLKCITWPFCEFVGAGVLLGLGSTFIVTFLNAYRSAGKTTVVNINSIGEANFEIVFFSICLGFGIVLFVRRIWVWAKS